MKGPWESFCPTLSLIWNPVYKTLFGLRIPGTKMSQFIDRSEAIEGRSQQKLKTGINIQREDVQKYGFGSQLSIK